MEHPPPPLRADRGLKQRRWSEKERPATGHWGAWGFRTSTSLYQRTQGEGGHAPPAVDCGLRRGVPIGLPPPRALDLPVLPLRTCAPFPFSLVVGGGGGVTAKGLWCRGPSRCPEHPPRTVSGPGDGHDPTMAVPPTAPSGPVPKPAKGPGPSGAPSPGSTAGVHRSPRPPSGDGRGRVFTSVDHPRVSVAEAPRGARTALPPGMHWRVGGTPPLQSPSLCPATVPLMPSARLRMAFVTDSNRPQPLWQPPTACLTASGAASEAPSLPMCPCLPPPVRNAPSGALTTALHIILSPWAKGRGRGSGGGARDGAARGTVGVRRCGASGRG